MKKFSAKEFCKQKILKKYLGLKRKIKPANLTYIEEVETSFASRLKTFDIKNGFSIPNKFLESIKPTVISRISRYVRKHKALKVNLILLCNYKKGNEIDDFYFHTGNEIITSTTALQAYLVFKPQVGVF